MHVYVLCVSRFTTSRVSPAARRTVPGGPLPPSPPPSPTSPTPRATTTTSPTATSASPGYTTTTPTISRPVSSPPGLHYNHPTISRPLYIHFHISVGKFTYSHIFTSISRLLSLPLVAWWCNICNHESGELFCFLNNLNLVEVHFYLLSTISVRTQVCMLNKLDALALDFSKINPKIVIKR
jgi:hypothetical protein